MGLFNVSLLEARRMTPYEYKMREIAYHVKRQKEIELSAMQAWLNVRAKATKKVGAGKLAKFKSVYKDFNDFYNSEKEFKAIFDNSEEVERKVKRYSVAEMNRRINKKKTQKGG